MSLRKNKILEIINFLEKKKKSDSTDSYSINENLVFFNSITSFGKFIKWLRNDLHRIDKQELTELTDFENENYSRELHEGMIKVERGKIPGFISPVVNKISSFIINQNSPLLIADLGSGSAETARQIIKKVIKANHNHSVTIVAFDKSKAAHKTAKNNISEFKNEIEIIEKESLSEEELINIHKNEKTRIKIILTNNNIFNISNDFKNTLFDLSYHSFFKHHLDKTQKQKIDNILKEKSKITFEYDGYHSIPGLLIQSLFVWRYPVLLNGAVFSNIRYYTKTQLKQNLNGNNIKLFRMGNLLSYRGTYLKTYNNEKN